MAGSMTKGSRNKNTKTFTMQRVPRINDMQYFTLSNLDILDASDNFFSSSMKTRLDGSCVGARPLS